MKQAVAGFHKNFNQVPEPSVEITKLKKLDVTKNKEIKLFGK